MEQPKKDSQTQNQMLNLRWLGLPKDVVTVAKRKLGMSWICKSEFLNNQDSINNHPWPEQS